MPELVSLRNKSLPLTIWKSCEALNTGNSSLEALRSPVKSGRASHWFPWRRRRASLSWCFTTLSGEASNTDSTDFTEHRHQTRTSLRRQDYRSQRGTRLIRTSPESSLNADHIELGLKAPKKAGFAKVKNWTDRLRHCWFSIFAMFIFEDTFSDKQNKNQNRSSLTRLVWPRPMEAPGQRTSQRSITCSKLKLAWNVLNFIISN